MRKTDSIDRSGQISVGMDGRGRATLVTWLLIEALGVVSVCLT